MKAILLLTALASVPFMSQATTLIPDCKHENSYASNVICNTKEIASMNGDIAKYYEEGYKAFADKAEFKRLSDEFIKYRNDCADEECLRKWYSEAYLKYARWSKGYNQEEVREEGSGYINLSHVDRSRLTDVCDIFTGPMIISSLQYDEGNAPNKIEFTSPNGQDTLVLDYDVGKMNTDGLSNVQLKNLEMFPRKNGIYFIKVFRCSSADGSKLERNLMEIYEVR